VEMMFIRIRNLREDKDLTQDYIAKNILHVSQRVYSNYECGDVNIPVKILIKLAEFYETSTDYLLGLTDVKKPYPKTKNIPKE